MIVRLIGLNELSVVDSGMLFCVGIWFVVGLKFVSLYSVVGMWIELLVLVLSVMVVILLVIDVVVFDDELFEICVLFGMLWWYGECGLLKCGFSLSFENVNLFMLVWLISIVFVCLSCVMVIVLVCVVGVLLSMCEFVCVIWFVMLNRFLIDIGMFVSGDSMVFVVCSWLCVLVVVWVLLVLILVKMIVFWFVGLVIWLSVVLMSVWFVVWLVVRLVVSWVSGGNGVKVVMVV